MKQKRIVDRAFGISRRVPASRPRRATESADDMPFKKELLVKAEQKIGGKDAKKLNHDAAARLSSADAAACLLGGGGKSTDLVQRRTAGGLVCRIIDVDKRPMLFEVGQAGLLPTLPGLWKVPNALPSLFTPPEVARFMINGADLLLPGVRAADAAIADLQPGAPACVRIFGNDAAIAVGVLVSSGATIAAAIANPGATKGVALAVEHVVGDGLWRLAGRPLPNAGFTTNDSGAVSVVPLAGVDPVGMGTGTDPGGSCSGGGGDAESEATTLGGAPAADGAPVDIGDVTEDVTEDDEAGAIGMAVAEMDELMKRCFLHAAIHVEDAKLPLLPNAFYNGHMRPKRPAGTSLDVKLSSWKKLLPFLKAMEKDGLCTLAPPAKGSTEPTIKALHRSAAGFAHFVGWEETAELAEARAAGSDAGAGGGIAGGGGGGGRLKVAKVYRPSEAMKPLFAANGATDTKRFYEEAEVFALLEGHVKRAAAADGGAGGGSGTWALDPLLCDALFKGTQNGNGALPTSLGPKECRRKFIQRLEQWTRVSGGGLEKPISSRGEPPKVVITTEQRRGHHVTLIADLSHYSLDPYAAARELALLCGATANVEEQDLKSGVKKRVVVVQGLRDRTVGDWLVTRHGLLESMVDNRTSGKAGQTSERKVKAATNVRKA